MEKVHRVDQTEDHGRHKENILSFIKEILGHFHHLLQK